MGFSAVRAPGFPAWGWRGMRSPAAMRPILPMASGSCSPPLAAWRAENLRLTRAAEALADTVPEALPLSDRWDDLCTLALVLGQRR